MQECQIRIANERKTIFRETGRMGTETGNGSHQTLHFAFAFSHFHSLFSARKKKKKKKRPAQQQPIALYGTFYWFFGWHYCCTLGTWKLECWKLKWEYSKDEGHFEKKKKKKIPFEKRWAEESNCCLVTSAKEYESEAKLGGLLTRFKLIYRWQRQNFMLPSFGA